MNNKHYAVMIWFQNEGGDLLKVFDNEYDAVNYVESELIHKKIPIEFPYREFIISNPNDSTIAYNIEEK